MLVRREQVHIRSEMLFEKGFPDAFEMFSAAINLSHDQQRSVGFDHAKDFSEILRQIRPELMGFDRGDDLECVVLKRQP